MVHGLFTTFFWSSSGIDSPERWPAPEPRVGTDLIEIPDARHLEFSGRAVTR